MATAKRTPKKANTDAPTFSAVPQKLPLRPLGQNLTDYTNHIVIHGDPHWKYQAIYRNGLVKLTEWMAKTYKGATIVSTGDQTDTSGPDWETFSLMVESLERFVDCSSERRTYYLDGNHTQSRSKGSLSQGLQKISGVIAIAGKATAVEVCDKRVLFLPHLDWNYAEMQKYNELRGAYDLVVTHAYPKWLAPSQPDALELPHLKTPLIAYGHVHYHRQHFNADCNRFEVVVPVPQPTRLGETGEDFIPQVLVIAPDGTAWFEQLPSFMTIERVRYDSEPTSKDNLLVIYDAPSYASALKRYSFRDGYTIHEDATEVLEVTEEDLSIHQFEKISNKDVVHKLDVFMSSSDLTVEEQLMAKQLLTEAKKVEAQQAAEVA